MYSNMDHCQTLKHQYNVVIKPIISSSANCNALCELRTELYCIFDTFCNLPLVLSVDPLVIVLVYLHRCASKSQESSCQHRHLHYHLLQQDAEWFDILISAYTDRILVVKPAWGSVIVVLVDNYIVRRPE